MSDMHALEKQVKEAADSLNSNCLQGARYDHPPPRLSYWWQWVRCAFGKHDPELRHVFYMWRDEPYIEKHCKHCDRELKNV